MENRPAQQSDWKVEPMPSTTATIGFDRTYTNDEFQRITWGVIPETMEDKWFIYFEEPWLYLHRSWTGYCIFQLRFEAVDGQIQVAEVLVNRDPHQYSESDDEARDISLLEMVIGSISTQDLRRRQMFDFLRFRR